MLPSADDSVLAVARHKRKDEKADIGFDRKEEWPALPIPVSVVLENFTLCVGHYSKELLKGRQGMRTKPTYVLNSKERIESSGTASREYRENTGSTAFWDGENGGMTSCKLVMSGQTSPSRGKGLEQECQTHF